MGVKMNILLVEKNHQNAELIRQGLSKTTYKIESTSDKATALITAQNPDVGLIIVDLESPRSENLQIVSELRQKEIRTPILILSCPDTVEDILPFMETPEVDFLFKPVTMVELRARIKALNRRYGSKLEKSRIKSAGVILDLMTREAYREEQKISLQNNEFELLKFLMRNSGRVITKAQILQKIWDYNFDPQTNVVDVLVWRLREKIDKHFPNKVIQTVRGVGYTFKMI
jgi:DNA-binding response OmpR family regulator